MVTEEILLSFDVGDIIALVLLALSALFWFLALYTYHKRRKP
jgi:hypothetical protein